MIVALAGGVGGAKLANGLSKILDHGQLHVVVNTGDDFEHFGLPISPDLDTVTYTLAGLNDTEIGDEFGDSQHNDTSSSIRRTQWLVPISVDDSAGEVEER